MKPRQKNSEKLLDCYSIEAIEAALEKGYRVEIVPNEKTGAVKLLTVHRKEVKVNHVPTA